MSCAIFYAEEEFYIHVQYKCDNKFSYGVFVQLLDLETKSRMEKGVQGITSLDTYFAKMREIVTEKKTSSRVRFLMQDVIGT